MSDPPKSTHATGSEGLSFESSLEQLEEIVDRLEGGDLPLEEALTVFEQGVALSRSCADRLTDAERRIEELVPGGLGVQPLDEDED
jgi:exodeoxyribonuclease VII small subunit